MRKMSRLVIWAASALMLPTLASSAAAEGTPPAPTIEERLARLEAQQRYTSDYIAIWKLQSLYQQYINIGANKAIAGLFADSPEQEIELSNKGILRGRDAARRYFLRAGTPQEITADRVSLPPGALIFHTSVNPVIEINTDGTRAKAVWLSPGITNLLPPNAAPIAAWNYGKYEMEYLKQDGAWRFLKFRWRQIFLTPYDKGWVQQNISPGSIGSALPPDAPSSPDFFAPYDPAKVNRFDPPPPTPYGQ